MFIIRKFKKIAYFWIASYFGFFAGIYLVRWSPKNITVTGSSGKTTLLHLFESQLRGQAVFSHKANSAFGIPFHILGLERKTFRWYEWFIFAAKAPFRAFRPTHKEKIYVTEADAERPGEGKFLSRLLKPEVLVWLSLEEAHGVNYDNLLPEAMKGEMALREVKRVIAEEFGSFVRHTRRYLILNKDNEYIEKESAKAHADIGWVSKSDVVSFKPAVGRSEVETSIGAFTIPALVPAETGLSVIAVAKALQYLGLTIDPNFSGFYLPPSRSSVFKGRKDTTLVDSTYNATFDGMRAMLGLFSQLATTGEKWLVLGDMIEEGRSEEAEHSMIPDMMKDLDPARIVLVGPRLNEHTYPLLLSRYGSAKVVSFMGPKDALEYLEKELKGGETILFKGARFLEGVVEKLLLDPTDASKLCRREDIWVKRRREWGV